VIDPGKAGEVMVGRADAGAALQSQRGDVGVRREIARRARGFEQAAEDPPVSDDLYTWCGESESMA
jgi:hypothetical protein